MSVVKLLIFADFLMNRARPGKERKDDEKPILGEIAEEIQRQGFMFNSLNKALECDDMGRLAQAVKHAYSGVECQFAKQIWLPFRRFEKIGVWATTNAGPDRLDKIFFGLLKNGVNTRKEIASRLGADRDSFVLAHLDILVREGYVRESGEEYEIAERGREFMRGDWTGWKRRNFPAVGTTLRIEPAAKFSSPKDGHKIEHAEYPGEDELLNALAAHFNAGRRKQGRVFYDVDDASKPGGRIKHEEVLRNTPDCFCLPGQGRR